jgi:hypothetical protein
MNQISFRFLTVIAIVCLFLTIFIFFPAGFYFLNDDLIHIPASGKGEIFQHGFQRPVHELLLYIETKLWSKNAFGYHLTKLLLHLACSFLLYCFGTKLMGRYGTISKIEIRSISLLSASIFLVYSFHSEAVLWILGRGALLGCFFFLLSMICYLDKERKPISLILSLLFFSISLFTYESVWITPLVVFIVYFADVRLSKNGGHYSIIPPFLFLAIFIVNFFFRYLYFGQIVSSYEIDLRQIKLLTLLLNFNRLVARSLLPPLDSNLLFVGLYAFVMILLGVFLWRNFKKINTHYILWGIVTFYAISLLPVIGFGIDTHDTESERFLYLPSIFLSLAIGYAIVKHTSSYLTKKITIGAIVIFYAFFSYLNARDYRQAGGLVRSFYENLQMFQLHSGQIRIKDLPLQFNGVPVFRTGMKEGINWLTKLDSSAIVLDNNVILEGKNEYYWKFYKRDFNVGFQITREAQPSLLYQCDTSYFTLIPFPEFNIQKKE